MKLKRMSLKIAISLIFCGLINWVSAQECNADPNCYQINMEGGIDITPHPVTTFLTTDVGYEYKIGQDNAAANVSYIIDPSFPLNPDSGLTLTLPPGMPVDGSDPANFIVLAPNGGVPEPGTYPFEIDASDGTNTASKKFEVTVEDPRTPVSVVFVLDRSGSMNSVPVGSSGTVKRVDILRTAASLFINKLEALNNDGDQAALTYFDSDVDNPNPPAFGNSLELIAANATNFTGEIASNRLDPGGSTAMGEGLLIGKEKLEVAPAENKQFIFLFTDGEQNAGREVDEATGADADGESLNNGDGSIQIMTIGTGAAAGMGPAMLLQKIAEANSAGGTPRYFLFQEEINNDTDIDAATGVTDFFDTVFESILSGGSPQTVGVDAGIMPPQIPEKKNFEINANIDKILFELVTSDREPIFTIEKDGVSVNSDNASVTRIPGLNNGVNSVLMVVDLADQPSGGITSEGIWTLGIRSGSGGGKPYQVKAQVDDHYLDYTFEVSADDFMVGDELRLNAVTSYNRYPLEDATISALIFKPGKDLGDMLARSDVKFDPSSAGDVSSVGYQKLLALIDENPALLDSLGLQENVVSLTHTAGGTYEAQFSDTDVTGAYQVVARISGTNATSGDYERVIRRTVYLQFRDPDPEASPMNYVQTGPNSFQLEYTPIYFVNGQTRFVGPGFAGGMSIAGIDISNFTAIDNGDGSYIINIDVSSTNTNPDITLGISGVEVFQGKASDFDNQGAVLEDIKDWVEKTFGISFWLFLLLLIALVLFIIWLIKKL